MQRNRSWPAVSHVYRERERRRQKGKKRAKIIVNDESINVNECFMLWVTDAPERETKNAFTWVKSLNNINFTQICDERRVRKSASSSFSRRKQLNVSLSLSLSLSACALVTIIEGHSCSTYLQIEGNIENVELLYIEINTNCSFMMSRESIVRESIDEARFTHSDVTNDDTFACFHFKRVDRSGIFTIISHIIREEVFFYRCIRCIREGKSWDVSRIHWWWIER